MANTIKPRRFAYRVDLTDPIFDGVFTYHEAHPGNTLHASVSELLLIATAAIAQDGAILAGRRAAYIETSYYVRTTLGDHLREMAVLLEARAHQAAPARTEALMRKTG